MDVPPEPPREADPVIAIEVPITQSEIDAAPDRNDLMAAKRDELVAKLKSAVGDTYQPGKQHLMAAENRTGVTLHASHP